MLTGTKIDQYGNSSTQNIREKSQKNTKNGSSEPECHLPRDSMKFIRSTLIIHFFERSEEMF